MIMQLHEIISLLPHELEPADYSIRRRWSLAWLRDSQGNRSSRGMWLVWNLPEDVENVPPAINTILMRGVLMDLLRIVARLKFTGDMLWVYDEFTEGSAVGGLLAASPGGRHILTDRELTKARRVMRSLGWVPLLPG